MAEFGKRGAVAPVRRAVPVGAPMASATLAAPAAAHAEPLSAWKSLLAALLFSACFVGTGVWMAPEIIRDLRLSGTWQVAYDLRVTDAKCTRHNFVLTDCSAKITSLADARADAEWKTYLMGFASGGGEIMVPVRSKSDPSQTSIAYFAEDKLLNRTMTFLVFEGLVALLAAVGMMSLINAVRKA